MADRARVAVLISGRGSNMAALIYAARADDCPYRDRAGHRRQARRPGPGPRRSRRRRRSNARLRRARPRPIRTRSRPRSKPRRDRHRRAGRLHARSCPPIRRRAGRAGSSTSTPRCCPRHRASAATKRCSPPARRSPAPPSISSPPRSMRARSSARSRSRSCPATRPRRSPTRVLIAEHQLYPRILAEFVARERDPGWIEAKVGELALALPETRFKTSHGSPGWRSAAPVERQVLRHPVDAPPRRGQRRRAGQMPAARTRWRN